jgi:hypothetical protein
MALALLLSRARTVLKVHHYLGRLPYRTRRHRFATVNHGHSRPLDLGALYYRYGAARMARMGSVRARRCHAQPGLLCLVAAALRPMVARGGEPYGHPRRWSL